MSRVTQGDTTKSKKWPAHTSIVGVSRCATPSIRNQIGPAPAIFPCVPSATGQRAKALIINGSRLEKGKLSLFSLGNDGCSGEPRMVVDLRRRQVGRCQLKWGSRPPGGMLSAEGRFRSCRITRRGCGLDQAGIGGTLYHWDRCRYVVELSSITMAAVARMLHSGLLAAVT